MQPRRVTIVSSPPPSTKTLPGIGVASPGSRGTGPVYRIEERSRTIYVSSDVDPKDWDTHSLNTILSLADQPDGDQLSAEPVRRSRSHVEREIIITPEPDVPLSPHDAPTSSRTSILFSRKPVVKSSSAPNSTPSSPTRRSPQRAGRPQILFYNKEDPYYGFTNFSAHPVIYKGKRYPTSEHLFQSFKFHDHRPNLAEHIRTCSERPSVAFSEARRFQPEIRPDWKQVNIAKMEEALFFKFTQHPQLRDELLGTGDAELIEDSDKDAFWGWGADRRGRNELGKALERLRANLRGDTN